MLSYNVEGIVSKLKDTDFVEFALKFDFITFVETFVEHFSSSLFSAYTCFVAPAKKLSSQGRRSGGVVVLIKNIFLPYVKQVKMDFDNTIVLEVNKELFGTDSNVFIVSTYINPINSPFYLSSEFGDGISMIEYCLLEIIQKYENPLFIICGDLNSRIGNRVPIRYDLESGLERGLDDIDNDDDDFVNSNMVRSRNSQDVHENVYGHSLLRLCSCFDLLVLNGMCNGDYRGQYTYISDTGCSVIDYFIISRGLSLLPAKISIERLIDSKHMPITLLCESLKVQKDVKKDQTPISRLVWSDEKSEDFKQRLTQPEITQQIKLAKAQIASNINEAVKTFTNALTYAASCFVRKSKGKKLFKKPWFDKECFDKRKLTRTALRKFSRSHLSQDRIVYCRLRKEYKKLISQKEKEYKQKQTKELESSLNDPKAFWRNIKKHIRKDNQMGDITENKWVEHFKKVFNSDKDTTEDEEVRSFTYTDEGDKEDHEFNEAITMQEVQDAINHLKTNKAAGPDGIIPEIFMHSSETILDFLVVLFNNIFDSGNFPEAWTESIIQPIHKKGSIHDPNNYRGISLLNICGKLYSYIINKRLVKWVEEEDILGEIQAGFRKDHSTIDHIFTLFAMIHKYLLKNKKLYVAFIDFRKAFDLIAHCKLWPILVKTGINGKMLQTIQSMYRVVKARIRCDCKVSEAFYCQKGLKQGEITSPLLFSVFINELARNIIKEGKHGIQLFPDLIELFILLFADDIVLLSDTIVGLQNQLNVLGVQATKLDLHVNIDKSNIVIFRQGGYIAAKENWYYKSERLTVVNCYKYLGLYLSTKLSFSKALDDMASRGRNAVISIIRTLWKLNFSPFIFFKMFDAQVKPIIMYGAEIWGLTSYKPVENVHTFALKKLLNVSPRTPNDMVYAETGRYPLYICTYVACIKYWLRLTRMNASRLPRKAYNMLLLLHNQGTVCWVSKVKEVLFTFGYGFVWENQGVNYPNSFIRSFKQRLIDCHYQNWNSHINDSVRFTMYRTFKQEIALEKYFETVPNKHIRDILIRFRLGVSELKVHKLRYRDCSQYDLQCPLCNKGIENELHFLFGCNKLEDLRKKFLPSKYTQHPCLQTFVLLMTDSACQYQLGRYIYYAIKRRAVQ